MPATVSLVDALSKTLPGQFRRLPQTHQGGEPLRSLGRYQVVQLVGEGGMGVVYEAQDVQRDRRVALKIIRPEVASDPVARRRFLREAQALAALQHDHIVTIYEVGQADAILFMAMEYLQGETLERQYGPGSRAPVSEVLRIGREVAIGLSAAHKAQLIHRDIKPSNLWLEAPNGRLKILDFGLAFAARKDVEQTGLGQVVGTPGYISLEQARGLAVDARSDLFSLGCVLYRLLTGRLPFQGDDILARLTSLAVDVPPALCDLNPAVPIGLASLVHRLLAKAPEQRPASANEVVKELEMLEQPRLAVPEEVVPAVVTTEKPAAAPAPKPRTRRFMVYRIGVGDGDFVIETLPDALAVIGGENGIQLHCLSLDRKFAVTISEDDTTAGRPNLQVHDLSSDLNFDTSTFTLRRGNQIEFRVWFEKHATK